MPKDEGKDFIPIIISYAKPLDDFVIQELLDAAARSPTTAYEEPWVFAVIQEQDTLKRLLDEVGVIYNADTMIVIYGKPIGPFIDSDCWLATQNLMLAAYSMGIGSSVVSSAIPVLNTEKWKTNLEIPSDMIAIVPIIIGTSNDE